MRRSLLAAAAAISLAMGTAGAASAATQIYDLSYYANTSGFTGGSLGTITVTDSNTHVLQFDVLLNSNVWYQMGGNGHSDDVLSYNLSGDPSVTYSFLTPSGGNFASPSNGGVFTGVNATVNGVGGQGFLPDFDYGVRTSDSVGVTNYYGNGSHLIFTVTGPSNLSIANLVSETGTASGHPLANIFFGADLRQCLGGDPTGTCSTGPVGAVLTAVPEPATWALMILGVTGLGATLRKRRMVPAVA